MNLYIPLDTSARSVGADEVVLEIVKRFPDASIVRNGSYGAFWLEPLVEIEQDNKRYAFANVSIDSVKNLLTEGKVNEKHEKFMGLTKDLGFFKKQARLVFSKCGWIEPFDYGGWVKYGGGKGLRNALQKSPQQVVDCIKQSGLRGRGGAAFPTGIKWQTVLDTPSEQKYIVCNADEGDSGTFADRVLMEGDPFTLIEGMVIAGYAVGAMKGFIYIRSEYPTAIKNFNKALKIATHKKLIGPNILGSKFDFELELRLGAGAYICGEETSLLESLEGQRGTIRYKPPLPAIKGLFSKPTVVNNVISLGSCPYILSNPGSFEEYGFEKSKGTLTVQLSGNILQGGLYELPFGFTMDELVNEIGGGTLSGRKVKTLQVGGPLGAYLNEKDLQLACDYETYIKNDLMVGHGGVVVFDDSVNMIEQAKFAMQFCADESCGKCTPCRVGSVRGVEVIEAIQQGKEVSKHTVLLQDLCDTMTNTSLCAMGGLTPTPVISALQKFPKDFSN